jgi:hypothetical protein
MAVEIPKPPRQSPVFAANTLAPGDVRGVAVQHLESGPELRQTPAAGMTACQSNVSASASLLVPLLRPLSEVCGFWGRIEPSNWRIYREKTNSDNSDRCYRDPWSDFFQDVRVNSKPA